MAPVTHSRKTTEQLSAPIEGASVVVASSTSLLRALAEPPHSTKRKTASGAAVKMIRNVRGKASSAALHSTAVDDPPQTADTTLANVKQSIDDATAADEAEVRQQQAARAEKERRVQRYQAIRSGPQLAGQLLRSVNL